MVTKNRLCVVNRIYLLSGIILCCLLDPSVCDIRYANVTLYYTGGTQGCQNCNPGYLTSTYACSPAAWPMDAGNWQNGTVTFVDPLQVDPSVYVVTQLSIALFGQLSCMNFGYQTTIFSMYLQGQRLPSSDPNIPCNDYCYCGNCVSELPWLSPEYPAGFPGYNYTGNNTFTVAVLQNPICLSIVQITLTYTKIASSASTPHSPLLTRHQMWMIGIGIGLFILILIAVIVIIVRRLKNRHPYQALDSTGYSSASMNLDGNDIVLGPRIGKGSYGDVYKAEWRGITVAVKRLPSHLLENPEFLKDFQKESAIMSALRHPNCLQFLGNCKMDDDVCIVMEYMAKGSLYHLLRKEDVQIPYTLVKKIALDVAQGMNYLHNLKPYPILHRDLKSHNLLVDENWKVKISDFGLSKIVESMNGTMTSCGTPAWAAPEVLKNAHYTEKADVYSFGICLWEFWTRKDPYEGMPTFQIIFAVGNQGERPTIPDSCPLEYANLMRDCWAPEPERRPSFDEIAQKIKGLPDRTSLL